MKCENVIQLNDKNKATVLKSIKNVKKHGILKKTIRKTCPCDLYIIFFLFFFFALKHILWVLVRNASMKRF